MNPKDKGIQVRFIADNEYVSPKELADALKMVADTIRIVKDTATEGTKEESNRLENRLNNLSEQIKRMVENSEKRGLKDIESLAKKITKIQSDIQKDFQDKFDELVLPDVTPFLSRSEYNADRKAILDEAKTFFKDVEKDTPEMTRDNLESLDGDERLDKKAIKGLDSYDEALANLSQSISSIPRGGGGSGGIEVFKNGVKVGGGSALNFTGAGVSIVTNSDGRMTTVNIPSGGGDGGGMVIGDNVSGANANVILFTDDFGNLAQDPGSFDYFADKEGSGHNYFHVGETSLSTWVENTRAEFLSDITTYAGYIFGNNNAGATASVDIIFTNDASTETEHYADIGFVSSVGADVRFPGWNQPNRAYWFNSDQGISFGGFFNGVSSVAEITQTFTSTEVNTGTEEITVTSANNLYNGARVVLTTSGSAPGGLTAGTTYFVINTNTDGIGGTVIKLATTLANALTGTAINLTSGGSGTHTLTLESSLFDFMGNGQGRDKVYFSIMKDGDIVARNVNNGVVYGLDARSDASLAVAIGIGVNATATSSGAIGANFQNTVTNTLGIGWGTKAISIDTSGTVTMTQSGGTTTLTATSSRTGTTAYAAQFIKSGASTTGIGARVKSSGATNNTSLLIGDTAGSGNYGIYQDDTALSNFFGGTITVPQIYNTPNAVTATANAATVSRTSRNHVVTNNSAAGITITLDTTGASAGDMIKVKSLPSSAVAQTITWVNTENSDVTPSANLNASTTSPRTDGFEWNPLTSKWRCIASC